MSTDVICQLAYDGKLQELQSKLQTDLKLACKKFQVFHLLSVVEIKIERFRIRYLSVSSSLLKNH